MTWPWHDHCVFSNGRVIPLAIVSTRYLPCPLPLLRGRRLNMVIIPNKKVNYYLKKQNLLHRASIRNSFRPHGYHHVHREPFALFDLATNLQCKLHWNQMIGTCSERHAAKVSAKCGMRLWSNVSPIYKWMLGTNNQHRDGIEEPTCRYQNFNTSEIFGI